MKKRLRVLCLATLCIVAVSGSVQAEMRPFWQKLRESSIALSTAACAGDRSALRELHMLNGHGMARDRETGKNYVY